MVYTDDDDDVQRTCTRAGKGELLPPSSSVACFPVWGRSRAWSGTTAPPPPVIAFEVQVGHIAESQMVAIIAFVSSLCWSSFAQG